MIVKPNTLTRHVVDWAWRAASSFLSWILLTAQMAFSPYRTYQLQKSVVVSPNYVLKLVGISCSFALMSTIILLRIILYMHYCNP